MHTLNDNNPYYPCVYYWGSGSVFANSALYEAFASVYYGVPEKSIH